MTDIIIRTDGSCVNNGIEDKVPMPGCAYIVTNSKTGEVIYKKAFKPKSKHAPTENRCEAFAMLAAVRWLHKHKQYTATIESDSKLLIDGITGLARRKANRDIWEHLESLIPAVANRIKAFNLISREDNSEADKLAKQAALAIFLN